MMRRYAFSESADLSSSSNERVAAVQSILRAEEECVLCVEAKQVVAQHRKARWLALVSSRSSHHTQQELALFCVKRRASKGGTRSAASLQVVEVLPVFGDLKLVKRGTCTLDFSTGTTGVTKTFEVLESNDLSTLATEVLVATRNAEKQGFRSGSSHVWVNYYLKNLNTVELPEDPIKLLPVQGTSTIRDFGLSTPTDNENSATKPKGIKDTWIDKQIEAREAEYTETNVYHIVLGTWNVNGKKPGESLSPWLIPTNILPEVLAIGFQELDLSAENFLLGSTPLEALWEEQVSKTLSLENHKYAVLATKRLVGVLLMVFVKKEHLPHITDVQTGAAAVGIMGMMGNKGGVAIRFQLYDSTICIVNCHLNAHFDNVQRRNQDYHDISRRILFTSSDGVTPFSVFDHEYLFWIGDLNYRVALNDFEVRRKVQEKDWKHLASADQLVEQIRRRTAFEDFLEGALKFPPTYKFDSGTNQYDTSEKSRTPAWCDRILWKGSNVNQISYTSHDLLTSDHKPVSSEVEIKVKKILRDERARVYQDIVRQTDKMENDARPNATIDRNSLHFDCVRYNVPSSQSITITNDGRVMAKFQLIPKLEEAEICKPWLNITPEQGLLLPGDKMELHFTVLVNNQTVKAFNSGKEKLEDILILHLDGGIDFFISLSGSFLTTCFGMPLSLLVSYSGPVRLSHPLPQSSPDCLSIPKELWRMVDYIYRKGINEEDLFLQSGVDTEMTAIRECLDTGEPFETQSFDIHSFAETLIRFLESLAEPMIPFSLYNQALACSSFDQCKTVISIAPPIHYNSFYYLMAFLREVLTCNTKNKLTADKLAAVFSSVLLRSPDSSQPSSTVVQKRADFVHFFLNVQNEFS